MKELSSEKMQNLQGGGWLSCGAMVLFGVATVAATVAITAGGPLTWTGAGIIAVGAAETLSAADSCVS